MDYTGKRLPSGFIYLISKKDLQAVNSAVGNIIKHVFLEGTAYTESKIYKNWSWGKTAVYIKTQVNITDDDRKYLVVYIKLFGVRESNFETKEKLSIEKDRIKQELFNKILNNVEAIENNYPISETQFIYLS